MAFKGRRDVQVYRPDLGQSTILWKETPEFHLALAETGGVEAFARSSGYKGGEWACLIHVRAEHGQVLYIFYYIFVCHNMTKHLTYLSVYIYNT